VPEDACIVELRHFCTSRRANVPSAKSANLALKTILKAPVRTEAGMLTLRCEVDTHVSRTSFYVEFKSDKAKEERAPEVKEVDFDEEFPFEKPAPVRERARDFAKALGYEIRPWSVEACWGVKPWFGLAAYHAVVQVLSAESFLENPVKTQQT
jgi:hypothetical protein